MDKNFLLPLKINCAGQETTPTTQAKITVVSENLEEQVFSGGEMLATLTLKNPSTLTAAYTVAIDGYQSWASEKQVSPKTFILDPQETQDVQIALNVNEDASGVQTFTVNIMSDNKVIAQKDIEVLVESPSAGITGSAIAEHFRQNWFIWVIVIINVILIVAIILVARRIVRAR